jgi:hypothetical protein
MAKLFGEIRFTKLKYSYLEAGFGKSSRVCFGGQVRHSIQEIKCKQYVQKAVQIPIMYVSSLVALSPSHITLFKAAI